MSIGKVIFLKGNKSVKKKALKYDTKTLENLTNRKVGLLFGKYFRVPMAFLSLYLDYYIESDLMSTYFEDGVLVLRCEDLDKNLDLESLSKDYTVIRIEDGPITRVTVEVALGTLSESKLGRGPELDKAIQLREKLFKEMALRENLEKRLEKGRGFENFSTEKNF